MQEWSLTQSEHNHVETLEEANDFNIGPEDDDFFDHNPQVTVYEMHDQAEENLQLYQSEIPPETQEETQAETNETVDRAQENPLHDQSAPVKNPPEETSS